MDRHRPGYYIERRNKVKQKAVDYRGGKCVVCGYQKCIAGLGFHHVYPQFKLFSLGDVTSRTFEAIKDELDKCVCICHNCHAEFHAHLITLPQAALDSVAQPAQHSDGNL